MTPHGTRNRYNKGKCRCEDCTAANAEYATSRRPPKLTYVRLPAAPLVEAMKRHMADLAPGFQMEGKNKGVNELAMRYANHYRINEATAKREVDRIMTSDTITLPKADAWATFLGTHIDVLWPPGELVR